MNIMNFLFVNLINGIMSALLLGLAFWVFKKLAFGDDFKGVLVEKGVSGAAVVIAAYLIAMGIAIGLASF